MPDPEIVTAVVPSVSVKTPLAFTEIWFPLVSVAVPAPEETPPIGGKNDPPPAGKMTGLVGSVETR